MPHRFTPVVPLTVAEVAGSLLYGYQCDAPTKRVLWSLHHEQTYSTNHTLPDITKPGTDLTEEDLASAITWLIGKKANEVAKGWSAHTDHAAVAQFCDTILDYMLEQHTARRREKRGVYVSAVDTILRTYKKPSDTRGSVLTSLWHGNSYNADHTIDTSESFRLTQDDITEAYRWLNNIYNPCHALVSSGNLDYESITDACYLLMTEMYPHIRH